MSQPGLRVEPSTYVEAVEFNRLAAEAHQARDVTLQRAGAPAHRRIFLQSIRAQAWQPA